MLFKKENAFETIEEEKDGLVKVRVFEPENEFDEPNCYCQNRGPAVDMKSKGLSNKYSNNINNESSCDCEEKEEKPIVRYIDPNDEIAGVHYAPDIAEDIKKIRFATSDIEKNVQHLELINNNDVSEFLTNYNKEHENVQQVSNDVREEESCKCKNKHHKHKDYDEEFEIIGQALFTIIKKLDEIEKKINDK